MEESDMPPAEAEGHGSHFKAPPVIKVEKRSEDLINPDARASAEEAAEPRRKRKGPSLFERMTGVGRMARKAEAERAARQAEETAAERREPAAPQAQPSKAEEPAQPRQEALSPSVRIEQKKEDEDLLDIPAFLRRQAN